MTDANAPIEIFCSYTHEDEPLLLELKTHLASLMREKRITTWYDRLIKPGTNWSDAIDTHLDTASLILLLVSAKFIASDFCYENEMKRALRRYEAGTAHVIPIILRPCDWTNTPFARLQSLPIDGKPVTMWENRDAAWNNVTTSIRRALDDLSLLTATSPHAPIWNVPYPRNSLFTGRDDLLTRLHDQLQAGQTMALSQPQAISGLGGIGKTQIAVEYAYRYRQEYEVVLWAHAENLETLTSSYNTIATLLKLPERNTAEQEIVKNAILNWLQTQHNWLLVLDNADDLDLVLPLLPPEIGGHLLLTTRASTVPRRIKHIEVDTFTDEQGAAFLLRRAGLLEADAELSQAETSEQAIALQLANEMGGLPLALEQAGAFLAATETSLEQYQQIYQRHLLQDRQDRDHDDHPKPVATTWSLSFASVEQKSQAAADLLRLCAFLSPDAIPEEILTEGASELGPSLESVVGDPLLLGQAIEALRAYSLIGRDSRAKTLSVHRLVQAVLQDGMDGKSRKLWTERAVRAVNSAFPRVEHQTWPQCDRLLPHALRCAEWIDKYQLVFSESARLLNRIGSYLQDRARYQEAEPLYRRALTTREQQLGPQHSDTVQSLTNLASLYEYEGKYEQAEPLIGRALATCEQELGPQHLNTAINLLHLGYLYRVQGKYTEAELSLKRALSIFEQQIGTDDPYTAASLNQLAILYHAQEKYALAEPLYVRALHIRERQLGTEHPDTAQSLNNLARLYNSQGMHADAEPLYQRALEINEKQLGTDHPETAMSLNNLAYLYDNQGKYAEAEPLYARSLAIKVQKLGVAHPSTQLTRRNYASLLRKLGRDEEATSLEQSPPPSPP